MNDSLTPELERLVNEKSAVHPCRAGPGEIWSCVAGNASPAAAVDSSTA